jgi:hypothetical protein
VEQLVSSSSSTIDKDCVQRASSYFNFKGQSWSDRFRCEFPVHLYQHEYLEAHRLGGFLIELRRLEPAQFNVLKGIHEGFCPDSRTSIAIVAEDSSELVGRIFLMSPAHLEGPWVREDLRGSMLLKRLVDRAEEEALEAGVTNLFAYSNSEQLADYLKRLGYEDTGMTVWSKNLCHHY